LFLLVKPVVNSREVLGVRPQSRKPPLPHCTGQHPRL